MTEAEVARDPHTVLQQVRQGMEVVIKQDSRPIAILRVPLVKGLMISDVIAGLEASGANAH
jgi:antitoxin (DNA-binding transcriptional repressor) of toxin-antitoxin stability system